MGGTWTRVIKASVRRWYYEPAVFGWARTLHNLADSQLLPAKLKGMSAG